MSKAKTAKVAKPKTLFIAIGASNWSGTAIGAGTTKKAAAEDFYNDDGHSIEYFIETDAVADGSKTYSDVPVRKAA